MPLDPFPPDVVARVREGDRDAFELIFRALYSRLSEYALGFVRSQDAAEDVVQEVFVALWTHRDRLASPDNLVGYLFRSVRNRSLNQLRRARVVSLHEEEAIRADPVTSPPPDRDADLGEIERAVKAAVERLPPRSRQVFRLSRDTGLTYPQIAETLGISIKTVETLMGRALKSIRERLAVYRR